MDEEHLSPSYSSRSAPLSFSEAASCTILELPSFEVPEQWLLADAAAAGGNENHDVGAYYLGETPAPAPACSVLSPADTELSKLLLPSPSAPAPAPEARAARRRHGVARSLLPAGYVARRPVNGVVTLTTHCLSNST